MYYEIDRVECLAEGTHCDLYVLVTAWLSQADRRAGKMGITEDFHIRRNRKPDNRFTRVLRRTAIGRRLLFLDGKLRAELRAVIEPTMTRLLEQGYRGDKTGDASKPLYHEGWLVRQHKNAAVLQGDGHPTLRLRGRET